MITKPYGKKTGRGLVNINRVAEMCGLHGRNARKVIMERARDADDPFPMCAKVFAGGSLAWNEDDINKWLRASFTNRMRSITPKPKRRRKK